MSKSMLKKCPSKERSHKKKYHTKRQKDPDEKTNKDFEEIKICGQA